MTPTTTPTAGRRDGAHPDGSPVATGDASPPTDADAFVDPERLRRFGVALDRALWAVTAMVCLFSLVNVHDVATHHGTDDPQAWLLAPIVDVALIAALRADAVLSAANLPPGGWAAALRWFAGIATWLLNVWDAAFPGTGSDLDPGAIVTHSVPPVILILLAEAAVAYRRKFTALPAGVATVAVPATPPDVDTPAPAAGPAPTVPAPRTGTPTPARTGTPSKARTGTPRPARTGRRSDTDLTAALTDVPRDPDGTVPVRRAAAALACGPDRARRLLAAQGLLRRPTDEMPPAPTPVLTAV